MADANRLRWVFTIIGAVVLFAFVVGPAIPTPAVVHWALLLFLTSAMPLFAYRAFIRSRSGSLVVGLALVGSSIASSVLVWSGPTDALDAWAWTIWNTFVFCVGYLLEHFIFSRLEHVNG